MTAQTLPWFEDDDPRELRRWAIAAAIVLGVHLGGVGLYAYLHQPEELGDETSPITIRSLMADRASAALGAIQALPKRRAIARRGRGRDVEL
jgi:hypothetical protein